MHGCCLTSKTNYNTVEPMKAQSPAHWLQRSFYIYMKLQGEHPSEMGSPCVSEMFDRTRARKVLVKVTLTFDLLNMKWLYFTLYPIWHLSKKLTSNCSQWTLSRSQCPRIHVNISALLEESRSENSLKFPKDAPEISLSWEQTNKALNTEVLASAKA